VKAVTVPIEKRKDGPRRAQNGSNFSHVCLPTILKGKKNRKKEKQRNKKVVRSIGVPPRVICRGDTKRAAGPIRYKFRVW